MKLRTKVKNSIVSKIMWFTNLKKRYLAKSPHDKWLAVRQFNIFLVKFIGAEFMAANYKFSLRTLIPIYLQLNYFALLIYTLYYYWNDPLKALKSTPAAGIFAPCLILLIIVIVPSTRKQYRNMYNFAGDFIYENSDISPRNNYVCDQMAIYLVTSSLRTNLLLLFSLNLITCAPVYKILFTGEAEMIMPVILPFVDPHTENGFYLNLANQLFSCSFGVVVLPGTELVTCVLKNTVTVSAAVIGNALTEFETQLTRNEQFTAGNTWKFRNIILQILDFDRYVVDLTDLYYWKFFLQPIFLVYSVTISLYLYLVDNWSTGIGNAVCCYIQLLILCDVGKTVDEANNSIVDALNQFPFYLLPPKQQRLYQLILSRMQKGTKIQMGPFRELNYETATDLTKMIYRYLMVMVNTK